MAKRVEWLITATGHCPAVLCLRGPTAKCKPGQRQRHPAATPRNANRSQKAPVFLTACSGLNHQGEGAGPDDDHKRDAHNKVFHVTSLRV